MSIPATIGWSFYAPFVVQKLSRDYGYSVEQAQMHVQERTATAVHALRSILFRPVEISKCVTVLVRKTKPEIKIAVGAGLLGLGLIGLVLLLKRK